MLAPLFSSAKVSCDTISFCHVFLNNQLIQQFNAGMEYPTVELNLGKIKASDSLQIFYFRDTPCNDCKKVLLITDAREKALLLKQDDDWTDYRISIPLKELKRLGDEREVYHLFFYRLEEGYEKIFLFTLVWK